VLDPETGRVLAVVEADDLEQARVHSGQAMRLLGLNQDPVWLAPVVGQLDGVPLFMLTFFAPDGSGNQAPPSPKSEVIH